MDLVLCHTTADFDTLGAAVGVTRLMPGSRIVLAGGCHPTVQTFLALHRDEYPLIERRSVNLDQVRDLAIVDTQRLERLGPLAAWVPVIADRGGEITLYDHHARRDSDIPATQTYLAPVGAATTLVVEQLQQQHLDLTAPEATVMALGIHVDTGSLTFDLTTPRDAAALAWLLAQGASQRAIADFVEPELSPTLQSLLEVAIAQLQREIHYGYTLAWVSLPTERYQPGLSGLAERLMFLCDSDSLLLASHYTSSGGATKLVLIGRARGRVAATPERDGIDLNALFKPLGGGGHATAAAVTLTTDDPAAVLAQVRSQLRQQIPPPPTAQALMSSPVRTIRPNTPIAEAQRILLRYGHSGLSVVDANDQLVGMISRRDIDLALHHGFSHAPVKGYMTTQVHTVQPDTPLPDIEALMVTYDIGRLPVLTAQGHLVGIVTRTDVMRQRHQDQVETAAELTLAAPKVRPPRSSVLASQLQQRLDADLWTMLQTLAETATAHGWPLYLVGGAVRDLLLTPETDTLHLQDVDLVVDGAHQAVEKGAGVVLAQALQRLYPEADLQVYGRFQTAALVWHENREAGIPGRMIDIATARTEFYPYPAANPEVEASSIRQDLYRRDFTINAMAICLTPPHVGQLLDFFGGFEDLHQRQVRVLHANSFIEDPTRIYRAVRFAVRLAFEIEPQTEGFIHHAIDSGIYTRLQQQMARLPALQTRLKAELKYILQAPYWQAALGLLDKLGALVCLHPDLAIADHLWHQMRRVSRWMQRIQALHSLIPWQMRLEVLIAAIPAADRAPVAENLQLPARSVERLGQLAQVEATLRDILPACDRPSQVVSQLEGYDLATLVLISVRYPKSVGQRVWRYLMVWSQVQPPLDGHDLKRLGYRPGPQYRDMLAMLRAATLDGVIHTAPEAAALLRDRYPLPSVQDDQ